MKLQQACLLAGNDVDTYVKENRVPEKCPPMQKIRKKLKMKTKSCQPPSIQLRYMKELPKPLADLIQHMMKEDINERMSCREAQEHVWIGGKTDISCHFLVFDTRYSMLHIISILSANVNIQFSIFRVRSSSPR